MEKINNEWEKYWFWGFIVIYLIIVLTVVIDSADAYMLNKAKVIYSPYKVILNQTDLLIVQKEINLTKEFKLPEVVKLEKSQMEYLNSNCHAKEGSGAYQSGYADACDYVLDYLGIRISKFKSRPSFVSQLNTKDKIIFNYDFKQFDLNLSLYKIEWRNNTEIFNLNESTFFKPYQKNKTLNNSVWFTGFIRVYGR